MKFITSLFLKNLFIISSILFINFDYSGTVRIRSRGEDLEVQALNLTIQCNGTEIGKGVVILKVEQKLQNVNGTNKNYGSFLINFVNASDNFTSHFQNFGSMPNKKTMDLDMRLIQKCNIDVDDSGSLINAKFSVNTKDTLNPGLSNFILDIDKSKNMITDVKKYFERANQLCLSTHQWAQELKNNLITRLTQIISIIPSTSKVKPDDVSDPNFKAKLQDLNTKIDENNINTIKMKEEKKEINSDIMRLQKDIDEKSRNLAIIQKQQEINNEKAKSAKKVIEDAEKQIKDILQSINETNTTLADFNNQSRAVKQDINKTSHEMNTAKGLLNQLQNQINDVNKFISEKESKIKLEQQNLADLTLKKDKIIKDLNGFQNQIAEKQQGIDSLNREGQNLQNEFNLKNNEKNKNDENIKDFTDKINQIINEQNKLPSNRQSELERKETTETNLKETVEKIDDSILPITKQIIEIAPAKIGEFVDQAYKKAIDPNNFDFGAINYLLNKIPITIWKPKEKKEGN